LDVQDALVSDNVAYALPPVSENMSVLLVGDDPFLSLALSGMPRVKFFRVAREDYSYSLDYDLTFFSEWAPDALMPGNYVFFRPPQRDYLPVKVGSQVRSPVVTDWDDKHPLLRFVNPSSFNVFAADKVEISPGGLALIEGSSTPLMVYGEKNYVRSLIFPFSLSASDLVTRAAYPVLMLNIVNFFRSYVASSQGMILTEGIGAIKVEALGEKVKVRGEDGVELEFPLDGGHAFIDVDRAGVYTLEVGKGSERVRRIIVANFFDESESDVNAFTDLPLGKGRGEAPRFERSAERRIWKWFSFFALVVLALEWFFYHRKGFR